MPTLTRLNVKAISLDAIEDLVSGLKAEYPQLRNDADDCFQAGRSDEGVRLESLSGKLKMAAAAFSAALDLLRKAKEQA